MGPRLKSVLLKNLLLVALVALWMPGDPLWAAPQKAGNSVLGVSTIGRTQPILSDFDQDNKVDRATLSWLGHSKTISIAFGKSSWVTLSFDSQASDRGTLVSGDVDNDGDIDLVWVSSHAQELTVWLGDGQGNFSLSKSTDAYTEQILTLLKVSGEEIAAPWKASLPGLVPSSSFLVTVVSYSVPLPTRSLRLKIASPIFDSRFSSVLKLRGPPSPLS
jgi:hypothetical protein